MTYTGQQDFRCIITGESPCISSIILTSHYSSIRQKKRSNILIVFIFIKEIQILHTFHKNYKKRFEIVLLSSHSLQFSMSCVIKLNITYFLTALSFNIKGDMFIRISNMQHIKKITFLLLSNFNSKQIYFKIQSFNSTYIFFDQPHDIHKKNIYIK